MGEEEALDDDDSSSTNFGGEPSSNRFLELRCVLAVVRHGDRTPKQKMKMPVTQVGGSCLLRDALPTGQVVWPHFFAHRGKPAGVSFLSTAW
jgi:hypothetical protein